MRKLITTATAGICAAAMLSVIAPVQAELPGDTTIAGGCNTIDTVKPVLPPWACPAEGGDGYNQGHYFMWHYFPETWGRKGGPTQPSYILANGAVAGPDGKTPDMDRTIEWIWALGSRAQSAWTGVNTWESLYAKSNVDATHLKDGKTPAQYVLDTIAAACPTNVEQAAKIGYTLRAIDLQADPAAAKCNFTKVVSDAFDAGTGRIGPDVNSTIWGLFYLRINGSGVNDKTVDYLRSAALPDGGWGVNNTFDYLSTAYGLMAFATLKDAKGIDPGAEPVVVKALDKLASLQNADGGWGRGPATTPEPLTGAVTSTTAAAPLTGDVERTDMRISAPIHGALRALEGNGSPQWSKFPKYLSTVPGLQGGRIGIQWLLQNTMQDQVAKSPTESRFQCTRQTAQNAAPESATDLRDSLCGARAVYNHIFWHPIVNVSDTPDGPVSPASCPPDSTQVGTTVEGNAVCAAVSDVATPVSGNPSLTG